MEQLSFPPSGVSDTDLIDLLVQLLGPSGLQPSTDSEVGQISLKDTGLFTLAKLVFTAITPFAGGSFL